MYIYQEFNESNVLKLQKSQFLSNFMPYNFQLICYGVNREVRQQLTKSSVLWKSQPPPLFGGEGGEQLLKKL